MRIETLKTDGPVHVNSTGENIELAVGDKPADGQRAATLSIPQAEMVIHALGLRIAQIHERQRRAAEERVHLCEVMLDTEFRLHEH